MNSTGESDEKMYRQTLEQERSVHIDPALERLIPIVCRSAIGYFPAGCKFKYPSLIEMSPEQKAQIIDQRSQTMERLFQANLIPGDVVLESFRNSQVELDITSNITDEHIKAMEGKYFNDLQQQADPYAGAMQTASEAGIDSGAEQVDENGNPIQPQVDENKKSNSTTNQIPLEELAKQMNSQQEMIVHQEQEEDQAQQMQEQQAQQSQAHQEQRKDFNYPKYRRIKHLNNLNDEDFTFEKFKKVNKKSRWN
jgi:hypothetical protein